MNPLPRSALARAGFCLPDFHSFLHRRTSAPLGLGQHPRSSSTPVAPTLLGRPRTTPPPGRERAPGALRSPSFSGTFRKTLSKRPVPREVFCREGGGTRKKGGISPNPKREKRRRSPKHAQPNSEEKNPLATRNPPANFLCLLSQMGQNEMRKQKENPAQAFTCCFFFSFFFSDHF